VLSEIQQRRIEQASVTVWIRAREAMGRGVLVGGQLILTAAHNIIHALEERSPWPVASLLIGLSMGDRMVVEIETAQGLLHVAPLAIDPVSDMAVLGPLDEQECGEQVEAYEAWCAATAPVSLCLHDFPLREPIPAFVYTHTGQWLAGSVQQVRAAASYLALAMPGVQGGTSGSPVVTAAGAVLGVISQTSDNGDGPLPRAHLTLPVWALRQIQAEAASRDAG